MRTFFPDSVYLPIAVLSIDDFLSETEQHVLGDSNAESSVRRAAWIQLARKPDTRGDLLVKLLEARRRMNAGSCEITGTRGEFKTGAQPHAKTATWAWASPKDLPPLQVEFAHIDGLWKLNTIIDPALRPWPLVEEATTPETE